MSDLEGAPLVSDDPDVVAGWAAECMADGLFLEDGIAQHIFRGEEGRIDLMVYRRGVGWAMFVAYRRAKMPFPNCFVRADMRRRGIGMTLQKTLFEERDARRGEQTEIQR